MSVTPHRPFWPVTRAARPLLPAKLASPHVSCCQLVGRAPLPLEQPDGNQCQHEPIGLLELAE